MKKLFTSLFLLMLGVMTTYATDYGLKIAGVNVTSTGNVSAGQSGNIYWDGSTLTFTNVSISSSTEVISYTGSSSITLKFVGTSTLNATGDGNVIYCPNANMTISGGKAVCATANLNYTGSGTYAGIYIMGGKTLTIAHMYLNINGKEYGIVGSSNNTEKLEVLTSVIDVKATNSSGRAISRFASATFDSRDAYLTGGAVFNSSKYAVCDANGNILKEVKTAAPLFVNNVIVGIGFSEFKITSGAAGLTAGEISYNYSTKELTFDNVTMNVGSEEAVLNDGIEDLVVKSVGTNKITGSASGGAVFYTWKNMTLKGDVNNDLGKGFQIDPCYIGLYVRNNSEVTFDNVVFVAPAERAGIRGDADTHLKKLTVKSSLIATYGKEFGAITGVQDCVLDGCSMLALFSPGVCYRKALKGFGTADALTTGEDIVFIAVPTEYYNINVLGTSVNNANYTNIAVDGLTAGTMSYDKDSKTLTLDGVTMEAPEGNTGIGIYASGGYLQKVALSNNNTLTTNGNTFQIYGDINFEGDGKLIATSNQENGISMYKYSDNASITINVNNTVKFFGKKRGAWGDNGSTTTSNLVLKKAGNQSDYYFKGETNGAVYAFTDLLLTDMDFYTSSTYGTPGTYFDDHNVLQNGGAVVKGDNVVNFFRLNEGDRYGIKIGGTEITACNMYGVGSKYITAGGGEAVTYSGGTLTLTNAKIDTGNESLNCIYNSESGINNLIIKAVGTNELRSTGGNYSSLNLWKNTRLTGTKINLTGNLGDLFASKGARITLDNIEMNLEGKLYGYNTGEQLDINLTTAGKKISVANSVNSWGGGINLANGTKIIEPEGAKLSDDHTMVVTASGATATGVVFADKDATGIEGVIMNPDAEVTGIFDAEGRQLNEMQNGVNILRMSDGTTRKVIKK